MRRLARILPPLVLFACSSARAQAPSPAEADFFEKEIRPLLAERCLQCHGAKKPRGGLQLTSRALLLRGGDSGPAAVAGQPGKSLLIKAIRYTDDLKMPPKEKLSERQIALLTRWVKLGLPWPASGGQTVASGGPFRITPEQRRFWSFQPVANPAAPKVKDTAWPRSDLDHFILAKLEARGLHPARSADKRTLIRRATFDLTGLPPTPEEVDAFLSDDRPEAFARVVDRLLASPHYGERWGRHWLDLVRYTDSFDARGIGGKMDCADAWRYRDWVIDAFNRDLPYDRFVTDQIAGDLVPAKGGFNRDGIVATGMLALGNWGGGDADKEKLLTDIADDQVDVVSRTFLGLTVACARCHDHKFDPISTADYYGLAGIFFSTHILPNVGPKTDGPPMLRIPLLPPAELARWQSGSKRVAELEALRKTEAKLPAVGAALAKLDAEIAAQKKALTDNIPYANGALEGGVPGSPHAGVHDVRIHKRGRYDRLGDLAPRRFPEILGGLKEKPITWGSGRLQLARWLTRPDNPLTARVMVNRIWQHHFGAGIVRTPSNFGRVGDRPTHPQLLDWLAQQFVKSGWSTKALHRTIMLSATYRQSCTPAAETLKDDPDNLLFGRMSRRRLEAEAIRDSLLAVSGRLDRKQGGPAVRDFNSPRRTVYLMTIRSDRSGFGPLFDTADPTAPIDRRTVSTVAPQALFLLNHPFALEQRRELAKRIMAVKGGEEKRIGTAYALLYGRPPTREESRIGLDFLKAAGAMAQAWEEYCQVLLCANEFIYAD